MLKTIVGALVGSLTLAILIPATGLLLGWLDVDKTLLVVAGVSSVGGAVLGAIRPGLFIGSVLFFLEGDVFD